MPNRYARWAAEFVGLASGAPKMAELTLIPRDVAGYGSAAERKRIVDQWVREVSALPKN